MDYLTLDYHYDQQRFIRADEDARDLAGSAGMDGWMTHGRERRDDDRPWDTAEHRSPNDAAPWRANGYSDEF